MIPYQDVMTTARAHFLKVSKFLGADPILTHHTAKITPVVTYEETLEFARNVVKE